MGEYADLVIDGDVCQFCFAELGAGSGASRCCAACQKENQVDEFAQPIKKRGSSNENKRQK